MGSKSTVLTATQQDTTTRVQKNAIRRARLYLGDVVDVDERLHRALGNAQPKLLLLPAGPGMRIAAQTLVRSGFSPSCRTHVQARFAACQGGIVHLRMPRRVPGKKRQRRHH